MIQRRRRLALGAALGSALGAAWPLATPAAAGATAPGATNGPALPGTPAGGEAPRALPAMRRGLNLTHWFEYERAQGLTAEELRQLRALGFDHVRLPLDPIVCGWSPQNPGAPWTGLAEYRRAIEDALSAGLEVVADLHLEPADKERIEATDSGRAAVVALWQRLARELAFAPPASLAFELFNEPQFYGLAARHWPGFQQRMLQAVRAQAPAHMVLLSGNQGGSPEGLQKLTPLPDRAVAYVFHTYAPYLFTHQGAHWTDTRWSTAGLHHGVRYPAALQRGQAVQLSQPHPRAAAEMAEYLAQDWNAQRIAAEIRPAARWAQRHGVRVVCNEFGVLRASADPASRYRWIADVRRALEAEQIGWTLWDYTDIFGITHESAQGVRRGQRRIEREALEALGLVPARVVQG